MKTHESRFLALAIALLAAGAVAFAVQAAPIAPTFEEANTAFASGNYHAAIEQYDAILARDGYSAPVLFNLANAFYRNGQFGAAILNYQRAQVLEPRDLAIASNLRLAREKAGVPAPMPSEAQKAADVLSPNTLAWIGSIAFTAICLAIGVRRFVPSFTQSKAIIGIAVVTLLTVATAFVVRWPEFDRAIAVAPQTQARIAPAGTAAELFALKAGEPVTVLKTYGQFVLIRTVDSRSGWVAWKDIGLVFGAKPRDGTSKSMESNI